MNTSEIIFITMWAVLALLSLSFIFYAILDDPWSTQSDSSHIVIAMLTSLALVAFGVTLYVSHAQLATHKDTTRQLAKSYQSTHSNEKPVTLNLDNDDANAPLPDTPDKDKVTKVFYTSPDGTAVSGGRSDYHDALKSDNPVYVFVKR